ncbi:uncharacterized protein OCT59_001008 [Rhizophagus irregularis]|uniref:uncharacterized protein n=1 Tax=Rhizophagus irregularis TaxID=588596 RepID=UPI003326BCD4|nr:hypothetical protein OCT59_001008 [Rhizophagus irregularis]
MYYTISAFGSWFQLSVLGCLIYRFQLSVLGSLIYKFRLSVLGHLILVLAFSSWTFIYRFRLFVLGYLIYSSYAFDLKLSVVMAATSHWALDRFQLQYLLKLWALKWFQLRYLWICEIQRMLQNFLFKEIDSNLDTIRKSAPESQ